MIIYTYSSINPYQDISVSGVEQFGKIQLILSILLLVFCILINTINLLRIARRTYRVRHDSTGNHRRNSRISEGRPLIEDEESTDIIEITEVKPLEADTQLFRHAVLVTLLTIDAIVVSLVCPYIKRISDFSVIVCIGFIMVNIIT